MQKEIRRITRNGVEALIDKKHIIIVGEAAFLQRYGLPFPSNEKENDRSTLCVSLNGGITAKLSVLYETEPVFEMLVERLYSEGISCAIHTYDPLINSVVLEKRRSLGSAPISVVHMNKDDIIEDASHYRKDIDGVVSCSSRLKLAEVLVWIKRLFKLNNISRYVGFASLGIGIVLLGVLVATGQVGAINQIHILAYLLLELLILFIAMIVKLPNKKYFTVDSLYYQLEKQANKDAAKGVKNNETEIEGSNE